MGESDPAGQNRSGPAIRSPASTAQSTRLLLALALATGLPAAPRKIVIDQVVYGRIGSNQQAILLVLQTPDVEVLGITVERGRQAGGNLTQALRMLELVERPEIPVLLVATHPLLNFKASTIPSPDTVVTGAPYHPPEIVPPLRESARGRALRPGRKARSISSCA